MKDYLKTCCPRVLIYCGLNKAESFRKIFKKYDYCFAFEANPGFFSTGIYNEFKLYSNVKIIHAALTTFDGETAFNVFNNDAASSVGSMCADYVSEKKGGFEFKIERKITVPAINLHNFCSTHHIDCIEDYISDLQGLDLEVLNTMKPFIEQGKIKNIQCEVAKANNVYNLPENSIKKFEDLLGRYYNKIAEGDGLLDHGFKPVPEDYWTYDVKWTVKAEIIQQTQYYSQIEQDKILDRDLFSGKEGGFFVEVGATDGYHFSNTLFFEKWRGWRGICIEPNPIEFEKLKNSSRTCIKENYAISSKEGEVDFLAIDGYGKGLSGIVSLYDARHLERIEQELKGRDSTKHVYKVKTVPLQILLDRHQITYIDYCSIDVEGAEMQVLESIDFGKTYIKCFTIENNYGLERETIFLDSRGYRLWKRVGCDDFFVKTDEYNDKVILCGSVAASEKEHSSEVIKKKINAHYAAFLPFQENMAIEMLDPISILNYTRFDVPAKVIYAKHRNWGVKGDWSLRIYDEHIRVFNGYDERDGTGKKGLEMFLNAFDAVIDSIRTIGFDSSTSVIPISAQGDLLEGAHRLAACLVFNKTISTVKFDFKPWIYDYRFFLNRGLSIEAADSIALEYCRLRRNTRLVLLFPSAVGRDEEVLQILRKHCEIVYEKKIFLKNDGPLLLMQQIYRDENWLGNYTNNFSGARLKARECFKFCEPLRVFVVESNNNDELRQAKQEIRKIYNIENHSVHINDTYEETLRVAQLLFNSNGIHFLNNAKVRQFLKFANNLCFYKQSLSAAEEAWFCVSGSAVMALYGLREARDIDYLHFQEPLRMAESDLVNSHNKEAKYYPLPIEDIIFDPMNYFYYNSVKFASLNVIMQMKKNRGEKKDREDILLIDPLIKPEISIIILNYNGLKNIKVCVESIEKHTEQTYELIIIDNASTDGSLEYLRSIENVILVENKENIGCPPARALALPLAKGNFVVLLDNDTVVTEGWIAKFKAHFKRYPDIGILGPRSNYVSGAQLVQDVPYKDVPGLEAFARKWADDHKGHLIPTHRLVGFCMFMSRAVIVKIGNIESGFGKFGFEDDDYSWRAIIAGFKTAIANDVFIHHSGGPQGRGDSGYNQQLFDAWEVFKKKWSLPIDLKHETPYNPLPYLLQVFRKEHHFIPILEEKHVEEMKDDIRVAKLGEYDTATREIPSLIRPEFINGMTSIIIPVQSFHLNECVSSIKKYTDKPHEIIFLEHGASPKLKKQITKAIKGNHSYKFIKIDKNVNFTQSLNEGINQSTGEYIVLLFDDVIVCEGWLADMLECLHSGKKVGIVGAMSDDASSLQRVDVIDFNSPESRLSFRERNRHSSIHTKNLDGFCMLFRRELLIRIGLFDEIFGGDKHVFDDFCVRAVLEGYNNIIAGNVFVHNQGGINRLMSQDKTIFDEKWADLNASNSLAEKVLIENSINAQNTATSVVQGDDLNHSSPGEPHLKLIAADMLRTMPVLLCYSGSKENWSPPVISENEIFCGPDCTTSLGPDSLKEIRTNAELYDISLILNNIPKNQWPELIVVRPTIDNRPINTSILNCPKVVIIGKDFYDLTQIHILAEYLSSEKFDYTLIDISQIPVEVFIPDSEQQPLSLFSILTDVVSTDGETNAGISEFISLKQEQLSVLSNLILLGERLYSAGKTVEAMKCFTHIITNSRDNDARCQAFNNIGVVAHDMNDLKRAEQMFISAIEIDPTNIHALMNILDVYITQGRQEEALNIVNVAAAAHPENEQIAERLALLMPAVNTEEAVETDDTQKPMESVGKDVLPQPKPEAEYKAITLAPESLEPKIRKLHIWGKQRVDGWEIINAVDAPYVDHIGNAADLSKFADETFESLYSSHVLEHFDYLELEKVLREWKRVLLPGGKIYVSVHNLDTIASLLIKRKQSDMKGQLQLMRMIFGEPTEKDDCRYIGLNQTILSHFLHTSGFKNIQKVNNFGLFTDMSQMKFDSVAISLNMTAIKPKD